jgi:hypothetical protein
MLGTSTRIWPDNYGADMSRTAERLVPPLPLPVLTTRRGAAFRARDSSLTAAARRSNCSAAKKQPRPGWRCRGRQTNVGRTSAPLGVTPGVTLPGGCERYPASRQ